MMEITDPYKDFTRRLKLLISKHPLPIIITLGNIFTMRLIGNKTHGDLAEIAMTEFINQYMYDFRSVQVGKDLYRAKLQQEDITIINEVTGTMFPVSLKAYGNGPLQLSTDRASRMFPRLLREGNEITDQNRIRDVFADPAFAALTTSNILPLIYDEKHQRCNILVFDSERARSETRRIVLESTGRGRKHPVYRFYDMEGRYICEVRYGGATANALQRGLWTHTRNAAAWFDSMTGGWIGYAHNTALTTLLSHALVSSEAGHMAALQKIREDIAQLKQQSGIRQ
jgi:hypothetical protein